MTVVIKDVPVPLLTEHQQAAKLIPEMTKAEWDDFEESVRVNGIQVPIHINADKEVLDGRHRLRAAKEVGLEIIPAQEHNFTEEETIQFVRDTAIERRNLSKEQRVHIVLQTDDLIKSIQTKAAQKMEEGRNKGRETRYENESGLGPTGPRPGRKQETHISNEEIANLAGSSKTQVQRMKKVKKEDDDGYQSIVNGERSIHDVYFSLPSVAPDERQNSNPNKQTRSTAQETKQTNQPLNQQPPELSEEESKRQMLEANVSTLHMHLEQLAGFAHRYNDDLNTIMEMAKEQYGEEIIELLEEVHQITTIKTEVF